MQLSCYRKKMQNLCTSLWKMARCIMLRVYSDLLFKTNAFFIYIVYFVSLSIVGFGILKALKPRTASFTPKNIDLLFTSVSAATVSSMSTVEMEVFSDEQLTVMIVLMFVGGEVFTSMVGLHLKAFKMVRKSSFEGRVSDSRSQQNRSFDDQIELSMVIVPDLPRSNPFEQSNINHSLLKYDSTKFLGFLVLGYLLVIHILAIVSLLIYLTFVSSAHNVLLNKGIKTSIFAVFTVVSTFASCGFVPTNENMMVFSKNSGLHLILIPLTLLGNTLFPSALRLIIWIIGRTNDKKEAKYLLRNTWEIGFLHLLPGLHSLLLAVTVMGFTLIAFILFSSMEWNSAGLDGLNTYQKAVGLLFQCVNARHTGETIVDLSTIAPPVLLFLVAMMYLPPYTSFLPMKVDEQNSEGVEKKSNRVVENFIFSHLSYLSIFIVLICIAERRNLKEDPLNFSVLNIIFEVISAYGNVGFTTGFSCRRQLRSDPKCVDKWYGFCGKWSDEGKIILIVVMFYGRLKQFNMNGGRAWKLL